MAKEYVFVADNQTSMTISVYEGEQHIAQQNNLLGKFILNGITPAPRGVATIIKSFNIDADGILTVTAEEKGTGNKNQITITKDSGRLSKEKIDRMTKEAQKYRADDEERRKVVHARFALENYANNMWDMVSNCSRKIAEKDKKRIEYAIEHANQWLDMFYHVNEASKFEEKLKELQRICNSVLSEVHQL